MSNPYDSPTWTCANCGKTVSSDLVSLSKDIKYAGQYVCPECAATENLSGKERFSAIGQSDAAVFSLWDDFLTDLSPLFKSDKITLQRELFSPIETAIYGDEIPITSLHSDKQLLDEKTGKPLKEQSLSFDEELGAYSPGSPGYREGEAGSKSLADMFNDLGSNKREVCDVCGSKTKYGWFGICQACKASENPASALYDSIFGNGQID